jgi:hypothetical protein
VRRLCRAVALVAALSVAGHAGVDLVYHPRDATPGPGGFPRLVVADPDAHGGTAQAAVPGQSQPDSYICALYSYARPAGRYTVTWRMKIDDNTIPDVVCSIWTGDEQGRKGYLRGARDLRGTDFAAANAYQDVSYTAEKDEGGFFGVGARWHGRGRIHIDSIRVVASELFGEREIMARRGGMELPETWYLPPPVPPVIHIAKGLWWDFFGLRDATAELGGAVVTSSYHASGQYGRTLNGFPESWRDLADHHLVAIANVDAQALGARGRLLLAE